MFRSKRTRSTIPPVALLLCLAMLFAACSEELGSNAETVKSFAPEILGDAGPDNSPVAIAPRPRDPLCNVVVEANCEVKHQAGVCPQEELHLVSVIDGAPQSEVVEITVERPGPVSLVLCSRRATTYRVSAGPGTKLGTIALSGAAGQAVLDLPTGTKLDDRTGPTVCPPHQTPDEDAPTNTYVIDVVETLGIPMTSYTTCESGSRFSIR